MLISNLSSETDSSVQNPFSAEAGQEFSVNLVLNSLCLFHSFLQQGHHVMNQFHVLVVMMATSAIIDGLQIVI